MPYRQDDSALDTDDAFARLAPDTASPRDLFYALTAQGVPPQQAMVAAYSRDNDVVQAALQGRPAPDASQPANTPVRVVSPPPAYYWGHDPRHLDPRPEAERGSGWDAPVAPGGADVRSGRPGFIPRAAGGDRLDPSYLDPRPEARLESGWTPSIPYATREDLGLPQTGSEQFAGVGLSRDASGGRGLDPHYAAQTRTALETERYIPSVDEIISGNRMLTDGRRAPPFGLAGPGSLNFDPSLESNNAAVEPFERSLDEYQRATRPRRAGYYWGGMAAVPLPRLGVGLGGGVYFDDSGRFYPQTYFGTPGKMGSAGHSEDLDGQLTGTSVTGSVGKVGGRRVPGAGVITGYGPIDPFWLFRAKK
jgi:hypothetical protein